MTFLTRIKAAATAFRAGSPVFPGSGGWSLYGPRVSTDYRSEIGNPMDSSIVASYMGWIIDAWQEAEEKVERTVGEETTYEEDHPLVKLLENPNPYYSGRLFREGLIQDVKLDGTAYIYPVRDAYGLPQELYWIDSSTMTPVYQNNGAEWIDHWDCNAGGSYRRFAPDEIIVWREGINRSNGGRTGYSRFKAGIAEVFGDNEARNTVNAILKNRAQMGVMASPDGRYFAELVKGGKDVRQAGYTEAQAKDIQDRINQKNTLDNRGSTNVFSVPMTITEFGSVLNQLDSRVVRSFPEERTGALFGVHPASVHLGSGLITSSDKHNIEFANRMSWLNGVLPVMTAFEELVNTYLLPYMDSRPETARFCLDTDDVAALQEDKNDKSARIVSQFEKGIIPLGVAQAELRYPVEKDKAELRYFDLVGPVQQTAVAKSLLGELAQSARERAVYLDDA